MKEENKRKWKNYGILALMLVVALTGSFKYISGYATVSSNVNGKELPICSVETEEPKVALTFDSAWRDEDIRKILDILKEHETQVTFFITGEWAEKYPENVKAIQEAGHDLGNHSQSHRNMVELSEEEQKTEIMETHEMIKSLTGVEMKLFRMPYDSYDDSVIKNVQDCGYYPIQWSVNSLDWKDYGVNNIIDTVLNNENLENGAIILCHTGTKYTAEALEQLIVGLEGNGFQIVPVSELIYRDDYHMDVTGRQIKD